MKDYNLKILPRTDLVDEAAEALLGRKDTGGIVSRYVTDCGVDVHILEVKDRSGAEKTGKPVGRYVTVNVGKIWMSDKAQFENACRVTAKYIRDFLPDKGSACLLAALGNKDIIADAVGPCTAENFIVTRHIKDSDPELFKSFSLRDTLCISPGVLGNTGIEAGEIIKGVADFGSPGFVIAVDSLASRRLSRLATTVQICDSGISPGSGINNARKELTEKTLGVPVIAIGVPTVVEASTLAQDIVMTAAEHSESREIKENARQIIEKITPEGEGYFVTPKETDHIIKDVSKLIGYAINLALHDDLSFDEIDEFLS